MRRLTTFGFILATISVLSLLNISAATGAAVTASPQDEMAQKLEALTKRVSELEASKVAMEVKVKTQGALLGEVYSWMRSLPSASSALVKSMDEARKNGFEAAGPNPMAKTNVLEGLKSFAEALNASNPAKKATKKGKK